MKKPRALLRPPQWGKGSRFAWVREFIVRFWRLEPSVKLLAVGFILTTLLSDHPRVVYFSFCAFFVMLALAPGLWGRWMWEETLGPTVSWKYGEWIVAYTVWLILFVLVFTPFFRAVGQLILLAVRKRTDQG
jgi:hypothetical protein